MLSERQRWRPPCFKVSVKNDSSADMLINLSAGTSTEELADFCIAASRAARAFNKDG